MTQRKRKKGIMSPVSMNEVKDFEQRHGITLLTVSKKLTVIENVYG